MHIAIAVNGDLYVRILAALVCWISPDTSISKRGRVRSGRDVIYLFLRPPQICCWRSEESENNCFSATKFHISTFRKRFFLEIGPRSSVVVPQENTACEFGANSYGNDQEILIQMSNTARYSSRIAFFAYPTCIRRPRLGGFPSEYQHPLWYGKTRMLSLPMVKKFGRYLCSFWHNLRTWRTDGQTDRHLVTAIGHRHTARR